MRSSILIETDQQTIVVDTGPDFRQQMLQNRVKKLDAVLFTHAHKDHTAGMDDIRSFNFLQKMDMPVYGRQDVLDQLKREFSYVFAEKKYPGIPQVTTHPIANEPFTIGAIQITPIEVMHHRLPVLGFRVANFTYITDANYISDASKEKIKGSSVLVLNALQKAPHMSHFTLDQALEVIEELKPKSAYLTHISHRMGKHREVSTGLPDHVKIAFDGLRLTVN